MMFSTTLSSLVCSWRPKEAWEGSGFHKAKEVPWKDPALHFRKRILLYCSTLHSSPYNRCAGTIVQLTKKKQNKQNKKRKQKQNFSWETIKRKLREIFSSSYATSSTVDLNTWQASSQFTVGLFRYEDERAVRYQLKLEESKETYVSINREDFSFKLNFVKRQKLNWSS